MGGRFTLSDDSHGVDQVGLNYKRTLECIHESGMTEFSYLAPASGSIKVHDNRFANVGWKTISIGELDAHAFWKL